jgi:4-aminobutyrate aminotransferase/(S)-3-amino-2-methylpropionate transaminase
MSPLPSGKESRPLNQIPGPRSQAFFDEEQKYMAPGLQSIALYSKLAIQRAEGSILTDADGQTYIDFVAGIGVASLGHRHPQYIAALKKQLDEATIGSFTTRARTEFLKLLSSVAPAHLTVAQLYSSGAEAVESALRLAKSYTGHYEILGFWGGFHGKTGGVLGLLGDDFKKGLGPFMPGLYQAPYADPYRWPLKGSVPDGPACAEFAREVVKRQTSGKLAAIVIEPIQGTAGNVIPPPGFLAGVRAVAHDAGALLICDEMLTGFGRTGRMFACEHENVAPDIITIGKGMGSGFPVSGVMTRPEIAKARPWGAPSGSSSSYGGNPLAAAAAEASLKIIIEESLVERSRVLGEKMLESLSALKEKYEFIGEVRGRGLMIGIELVKDRATKEPLSGEITKTLFFEALRRGLLSMCYGPRIRINPPLTIPEEQAEEGIRILDESFEVIDRVDWRRAR